MSYLDTQHVQPGFDVKGLNAQKIERLAGLWVDVFLSEGVHDAFRGICYGQSLNDTLDDGHVIGAFVVQNGVGLR